MARPCDASRVPRAPSLLRRSSSPSSSSSSSSSGFSLSSLEGCPKSRTHVAVRSQAHDSTTRGLRARVFGPNRMVLLSRAGKNACTRPRQGGGLVCVRRRKMRPKKKGRRARVETVEVLEIGQQLEAALAVVLNLSHGTVEKVELRKVDARALWHASAGRHGKEAVSARQRARAPFCGLRRRAR